MLLWSVLQKWPRRRQPPLHRVVAAVRVSRSLPLMNRASHQNSTNVRGIVVLLLSFQTREQHNHSLWINVDPLTSTIYNRR
jgi:hypothetical protein